MKITIPDFALVLLIGPTGAGKSQFARRHFRETEVIASDHCRALVADDEADQSATEDAFAVLEAIAGRRLKRRRFTVIDATSVRREDRARLVALARRHHALPVPLVLDIDPQICAARNEARPDRAFGAHVPHNHAKALRRDLRNLGKEGFRHIHVLRTPQEVDAVEITRVPLWTDQRHDHGPFDMIGDVHGCFDELTALLDALGYQRDPYAPGESLMGARHPDGRRAFFVGDLTDRGPRNVDCLRLVMGMCAQGQARCVIGNHDFKLSKWLRGRKVKLDHGLDGTVAELEACSPEFRAKVADFIDGLLSHAWLADGALVVAHAGLKEEMHGRGSAALRSFAMFGETTGETDEAGLPVRLDWVRDYRGDTEIVYGHIPVAQAQWRNNTLCIDTGCVFGGALTALRWPERAMVSVPAAREYAPPLRPLRSPGPDGADGVVLPEAAPDDAGLLFFDDFARKQRIQTRLGASVTIPEENALAALEILSRFGIDPRWLIHLPPTMAAPPTAHDGSYLEHPDQALAYYARQGGGPVIVEEKHMGSRALIVVARDAGAAARRFGVTDGRAGVVHTRTGRAFFADTALEAQVVARIAAAVVTAGLWDELATDWLLLDAEIMPWSGKAQDLLARQYRPTATAAQVSAQALLEAIAAADDPDELQELRARAQSRKANAEAMQRTLAGYCWEADTIDAWRIAPFHLLAVEGRVLTAQPHHWHMQTLAGLCAQDPILRETGWQVIDPASASEREAVVAWWERHTAQGGEGLVIKPDAFIVQDGARLVQPAMKVRGRDYLRLVYGPDYDMPDNLVRLRQRALNRKNSLAEREFRLGLEGLERFVARRSLREVHACALGVLALESEPVDPRL
ncbi:MAG: polynucleotide kinase-phosphatase [Salinarimonas sp.]|nr:polynucleotide kinase-phosphatase [Salinarimonas sp.]